MKDGDMENERREGERLRIDAGPPLDEEREVAVVVSFQLDRVFSFLKKVNLLFFETSLKPSDFNASSITSFSIYFTLCHTY